LSAILMETSERSAEELEFFAMFIEQMGLKLYNLPKIASDELSKGRLIMIAGKRFEKYDIDERDILLKHIRSGHRLLAMVDAESTPFFDSLMALLEEFGIYFAPEKIRNDSSFEITTKNINRNHEAVMGIEELTFVNSGSFKLAQKRMAPIDVLVRSEEKHIPPNAVLACATRYGNGKIVTVSTWEILKQENLFKSDNALFVMSLIYWLLDQKPPQDLKQRIQIIL